MKLRLSSFLYLALLLQTCPLIFVNAAEPTLKVTDKEPPKELAAQLKEQQLKSQVVTFRVDMTLWERIDEYATKLAMKRSDAVKRLVEKGLEADPITQRSGEI